MAGPSNRSLNLEQFFTALLLGDPGYNGTDGLRGRRGKSGLEGAPGPMGPHGLMGLKGDKGDTGTEGVGGSGGNCTCKSTCMFKDIFVYINDGFWRLVTLLSDIKRLFENIPDQENVPLLLL